jgi:hypothetical protein
MARFVNTKNGVVVDVDADTASRLAPEYVAEVDNATQVASEVTAPAKRGRPKKEAGVEPVE